MEEQRDEFTIEGARRNRISKDSRTQYRSGINQVKKWIRLVEKDHLLMNCTESKDGQTINLQEFGHNLINFAKATKVQLN